MTNAPTTPELTLDRDETRRVYKITTPDLRLTTPNGTLRPTKLVAIYEHGVWVRSDITGPLVLKNGNDGTRPGLLIVDNDDTDVPEWMRPPLSAQDETHDPDHLTREQSAAIQRIFASMPYGASVWQIGDVKTVSGLVLKLKALSSRLDGVAAEMTRAERQAKQADDMLAGLGELILTATETANRRRDSRSGA